MEQAHVEKKTVKCCDLQINERSNKMNGKSAMRESVNSEVPAAKLNATNIRNHKACSFK